MQAAEYEVRGKTLVIRLKTDLDHHTALAVRETADRMMERSMAQNVLFDFSGIDFMDSSGIGVIMGRYRQVSFSGGRVGVAGVGSNIARILNFSGLNKLLDHYETAEDALTESAMR